jgi:F-type H+-transporting ATPase subunit a
VLQVFSPLEPFELLIYCPITIGGLDISITSVTVYFLFGFCFFVYFFGVGTLRLFLLPTPIQSFLERFYVFVLGLVQDQTKGVGVALFPLFLFLLPFIALVNLVGLFPYSYAATAHFSVTFTLSLILNGSFLLLGFYTKGLKFFQLFIPSGAPAALLPLIVAIELVSYLIRSFSLAIRLFANMTAGHTLLHILGGFAALLLAGGWLMVSIPTLFLVFFIFLLEVLIAFIQAYVFTILLLIYLSDVYSVDH